MKAMLAVIKRMGINPENQPLKKAVEVEIAAEWKKLAGSRPLSPTEILYMATFVREPESQAGRGAKKRPAKNIRAPQLQTK
jgi:hypothetical protein